MKRKIPGVLAIVLALSLSAFTSFHKKEATGYFWFPLDSSTGAPKPVSTLVYLGADPYLCTNWAPGGYCSGGFTSYARSGSYYVAAGTQIIVHFSLFY